MKNEILTDPNIRNMVELLEQAALDVIIAFDYIIFANIVVSWCCFISKKEHIAEKLFSI